MIKAVADYVRNIQDTSDLDAIAKDVFQHSQVKKKANCNAVYVSLKLHVDHPFCFNVGKCYKDVPTVSHWVPSLSKCILVFCFVYHFYIILGASV